MWAEWIHSRKWMLKASVSLLLTCSFQTKSPVSMPCVNPLNSTLDSVFACTVLAESLLNLSCVSWPCLSDRETQLYDVVWWSSSCLFVSCMTRDSLITMSGRWPWGESWGEINIKGPMSSLILRSRPMTAENWVIVTTSPQSVNMAGKMKKTVFRSAVTDSWAWVLRITLLCCQTLDTRRDTLSLL